MPIISKPSPITKGETHIFSIDKSALALHPSVVASEHFSSPNVWEKIIVKFKSETLGQFESVEFDASVASPEGQFFVSSSAEDIFEVEKLTIVDKDGAILLIPRASLTAAEFDINFTIVPPIFTGTYVDWTEMSGYTTQLDGGLTSDIADRSTSSVGYIILANNNPIPSNISRTITFKLKGSDMWKNGNQYYGITYQGLYFGFYKSMIGDNADFMFLYGGTLLPNSLVSLGYNNLFANNSTELILQLKITGELNSPSGFQWWVNGTKVRQYSDIQGNYGILNMYPAARLYTGDELVESYIEPAIV